LLIIGFDGTEMTTRLSSLLKRLQPAGIILFARNIKSAQQTWRLLRDCQKCVTTPLFTCVDLEGGTVDRFRDALGATPSAAGVFASCDRKLFRRHGQIIGQNCRALGFNVDFAPALDLAYDRSRSIMGSRAVSTDPRHVALYAKEFLTGLRTGGVLGCGKHFPGLGEGSLDSHDSLPVIEKPLKQMWSEDLAPYRALRRRLPFVMVAHAAYPAITGDNLPASISKLWIERILRRRVGYKNLIVSDDLEMGGVLAAASVGQAAIEHIRAGGDLCLVCHREEHVLEAYDALIKTGERDRKFTRRMSESAHRVIAFKKKWRKILRPAKAPSTATVEKLTRQLWEFDERVRLETLTRGEGEPRA
jgi:beta-N-acetylhexosaminidase